MATKKTIRKPTVKLDSAGWSALLETKKHDTHVIGPIQRMLLAAPADDGSRRRGVLHPSQICKPNWCPRESYYEITGAPFNDRPNPSIWLEKAFQDGHVAHAKWQGWLWDAGMLSGRFECLGCEHRWEDTAPDTCPGCGAQRHRLRYREVAVDAVAEYLIYGHADGEIGEDGVEVKTIGQGTVRKEAPELWSRFSTRTHDDHAVMDLEGLWRSIKQPFAVHRTQGHLYGFVRGWTYCYFIYDCKWNAAIKEFKVKVEKRFIDNVLDRALDVKWAVEKGREPERPHWAAPTTATCKDCPFYEHCWQQQLEQSNGKKPGVRYVRRVTATGADRGAA